MSEEAEEDDFFGSFGDQYGYLGQINRIRKQEFNRLEGNDISSCFDKKTDHSLSRLPSYCIIITELA